MSDKLENCPVCKNKLNEHRVQDFIDCIQKLFEKNEDVEYLSKLEQTTGNAKNQEALSVITDLLKKSRLILTECDKDPNLNKLAIKYLLAQKELLEKLRDILV